MTTEETTGGINMTTEEIEQTEEIVTSVTMTIEKYEAMQDEHHRAKAELKAIIHQLRIDLATAQSNTLIAMIRNTINEEVSTSDFITYDDFGEAVDNWGYLDDRISTWADYNIQEYVDYREVRDSVIQEIDFYNEFHNALENMCSAGENTVAHLVTRLIEEGAIQLPTAPEALANKFGPEQQVIYTALDQIRGGITTLLAQMDANPPEVTADENNE